MFFRKKILTDTIKEIENEVEQLNRFWVSFTGHRLYGVPYSVANSIVDKIEYSQLNKVEFTDEKISIKEVCVPMKVDRLGNITKIG